MIKPALITKVRNDYLTSEVLGPFAAIYGVGFAPLLILPFLFTALMSYFSISEADAGLLASIELGAMCLGSLIIAPIVDKFAKKYFAVLGIVLAVLGNLLLMSSENLGSSYGCLVIAGLGYGVALASGNSAVAALGSRSATVFNKVVLLGTLMMIVLLNVFPRIIAHWSLPGALIGLSVLHLMLLPLVWAIPKISVNTAEKSETARSYQGLFKPLSLAIIAMMFCYFVRDTMVWVFAENIASSRLGISPDNVGLIFSVHGAMSLLGPLILIWLMRRFAKDKLLLLGIVVTGCISIVVSQTQSVAVFTFMAMVWSTAHFFTYSCIMGFAASADAKGAVAAVAGAAVMGGTALAPAIAGFVMDRGGQQAFTGAVIASIVATFIFAYLGVYLRQKTGCYENLPQANVMAAAE